MGKLKTHEEFIRDLYIKNDSYRDGNLFVLSKYKGKEQKILLKDKYGYLKSIPNNLLKNSVLNIRAALHPNEYVKELFKEVHGYRYNYDIIDYKNATNKLKIICKKHGVFYKNSNKHLSGEGCQKCKFNQILHINKTVHTGWSHSDWLKASKISINFESFKVYVIRLFNEKESFIKIGRTYTSISKRMKHIPYKYEIIKILQVDSLSAIAIECDIKKSLKTYKYSPIKEFGGMRECFTLECLKEINTCITNNKYKTI